MTNESIYHGYAKRYEKQVARLNKENTSDHNKDLIRRFQAHLFATGTNEQRVAKLTWNLRKIAVLMRKDLDKATKQDIERVVAELQTDQHYTDNTKSDYKRGLKHFYKWFEDEDIRLQNGDEKAREAAQKMYKYLRKYVKTTVKPKPVDPSSIITDEEIEKVLVKGCRNDMERALLKLLHETGCRIGELLGMRIKDIQRKEHNWLIVVNGKTGERAQPILDSIPLLLRWLDYHPLREDPDAYLFTSVYKGRWENKRIMYWGARRLIDRCFTRAGVNKQRNPHWFRHSRATLDAPKYTEAIQCKLRGWAQGSRQPATYHHIAAKQVEDAFLKARGVKKADEMDNTPQPLKCVCGRLNEAKSCYCSGCGKALTVEVAVKEGEYMEKAFFLFEKIMGDPALRRRFEEWKQTS